MKRVAALAPVGLALASLLPHARAVWPDLTYYFRDFTVTFYPLRLFWARELREGRWPGWNPYVYEGVAALPVLYPPDLLHVLWPSPAFVSWLLTLHFPVAALGAWGLARELGLGRAGAFVAGAAFSLSGLCLSSLNLYVFLQALALAPWLVLTLRRAVERGGRWIPAAAVVFAVGLSTLAVEFVLQAVLLGVLVALSTGPRAQPAGRLAVALALGAGLAAVPVLVTGGILRESVRGAGFAPEVALGNAVHPAVLLQMFVPDLFGSLAAPVEAWWGGRFFSKGFPYLLSLYLGPLTLALAALGAGGSNLGRRRTAVLLAAGAAGLWYALGAAGGLAALLARLPGTAWFRFPSKAMLLPVFVLAVLAGAGADTLAQGRAWRRFAGVCLAVAAVPLVLAALVFTQGPAVAAWANVPEPLSAAVQRTVSLQAAQAAALALAGALVAVLVRRGRVPAAPAVALLSAMLVADLARAGAGLNPQAPPGIFALLPELEAQRLDALAGGRVFSLGLDESPAFRRFLGSGAPGRGLWSFFLSRQMLVPFASVLDQVETAHGKDLTSFVPRGPEMRAGELEPARVGGLIGRLRGAAVSRVLSLDPLDHPDLHLRARVPGGPPRIWIHVFELSGPAPRASFVPGRVRTLRLAPAAQEYEVEAERAGELVVRDSFASGWRAWVDGVPAPVQRAEGRYRSVAVGAGRHRVHFAYVPPGLYAGLVVMAASAAAALVLARKPVV